MKKIALNIFVALFILCFSSLESFAFGYTGCERYNIICKVTGKGAKSVTNANMNVEENKNDTDKRRKIITSKNDTELNFFTGMFDFSDDKQAAGILGFQHQDEKLFRKSLLGKLSPITGGFVTANNATYLYTGVQAEYVLGFITITPSFAPGLYHKGNGKDLGSLLEFKSEVQMTFNLSDSSHLGMSYNHISNASLGTKNPGANSYMFNFLKQF